MELFKCQENSKFIKYQTKCILQFKEQYSKQKLSQLKQDLIWGDIQNKEKFIDKLYYNILVDIEQNLNIYKQFTKYAFSDNKLIIIGDVLYNTESLNQLYNLIQINCFKINGIIFKDNGKIPARVFSDLMKYIFLIPKLEQITFLSSVLDESNLYELKYLIFRKKAEYLILYRSYFLQNEIDTLLDLNSKQNKIQINHYRFVLIDLQNMKHFEFTPYAFDLDDLKQKKKEDMLDVEWIYKQQQYYPKKIYSQVVFFQGRNLSILNKSKSDNILFQFQYILQLGKDQLVKEFKEKQEYLIQVLGEQFKEDDINILNYSLIKNLIRQVIDTSLQKKFEKILKKSKSYKYLNQKYPINVVENITYKNQYNLQTAQSYLMGFTFIKEFFLNLLIHNEYLNHTIKYNNREFLQNTDFSNFNLLMSLMIKEQEVDQQQIQMLMNELDIFLPFENQTALNIPYVQNINYKFLNDIFIKCKNLQHLKFSGQFDNVNLQEVDFSLVSQELRTFYIGDNKNNLDMNFMNILFTKARKLERLTINKIQMADINSKIINFHNIPKTLEEISMSYINLNDPNAFNIIFQQVPNLKQIDMNHLDLTTETIKQIQFAPGLKEIKFCQNYSVNFAEFLIHLGLSENLNLQSLTIADLQTEFSTDIDFQKYNNQLKGFSQLTKLNVSGFKNPSFINLIFSNISKLSELVICDNNMSQQIFEQFNLDENFASLQKLDISDSPNYDNYQFLQKIFEKSTQLKFLSLQNNQINDDKFKIQYFINFPVTIEEFNFNRNSYFQNFSGLLNTIFSRCINLKIIILSDCKLNDQKLKDVDFNKISTNLEAFDIQHNPGIQTYYFLNDIFQRAQNIKRIYLFDNKIGQSIKQINFELLNKQIQFISISQDYYDDEQFQDQLLTIQNRQINYYKLQQKYSNASNYKYVNYFGVFEKYNLAHLQKEKIQQQVHQKEFYNELTKIIAQNKNKEVQDNNLLKVEKQNQNNQNMNMFSDLFQGLKYFGQIKYINPLFFYTFFKRIDQTIKQDIKKTLKLEDITNKAIQNEKIIQQQNVYINNIYNLIVQIQNIQLDDFIINSCEQQTVRLVDEVINYSAIKEIKLQNEVPNDFKLIDFIFQNCLYLTKLHIDLVELNPIELEYINFQPFNYLIEINFKRKNNSTKYDFILIDLILENSPNLQDLDVSRLDFDQYNICNFDFVSCTLQKLDLSFNTNISDLKIINNLLKRCAQLQVLKISNMQLNDKKIGQTQFKYISQNLEVFNCSKNGCFNSVDFINRIINRCQKLKILNISGCYFENEIKFEKISNIINEIDISNCKISQNIYFLIDIIYRCKQIEKLNMSFCDFEESSSKMDCEEIDENYLREFNLSPNLIINYDLITQIINKSKSFRRLGIYSSFWYYDQFKYIEKQDIGKQIHELYISGKFQLNKNDNILDIFALKELKQSSNFSVLVVQKNFDNQLMSQFEISQHFRNLEQLVLSGCKSFDSFEFMNQVFSSATKLEILDMSDMNIDQTQIKQINFDLTPYTLQSFDISNNKKITDFSFLMNLFKVTQSSLTQIRIKQCNLKLEKLKLVDLQYLSKSIDIIDISGNEELESIDFLKVIFDRNDKFKLKELSITKINYNITLFLTKYYKQIQNISYDKQIHYNISFFTNYNYNAQVDIIQFLKYLSDDIQGHSTKCKFSHKIAYINIYIVYIITLIILLFLFIIFFWLFLGDKIQKLTFKKITLFQSFHERISLQSLFKRQDSKGIIFHELIENIIYQLGQNQSILKLSHFLFLLLNDNKLIPTQFETEFLILSPYSLFQLNREIDCQLDKQDRSLFLDTYNLSFLYFNLVNKQTDYIFAYDKFYFKEFTDFYLQILDQEGSDLQFIIDLKKKMEENGVSGAFLPITLTLTPNILKKFKLSEFDVLCLINFIPPASINLKGMSIQFVKSWYAINYYAPLSTQTFIDVNYDLLENSSIANYLSLLSYNLYIQNFEGKTFFSQIKQFVGWLFFKFFSIFGSFPKQYNFDHTVVHLENLFKQYVVQGKHNMLRALYPLYLFVCLFGVWYFSYDLDIACGNGISWYSYVTYAVFGFITFFIEAFIFQLCLKHVSHLVPEFKPDCRVSFPYPIINRFKAFIMDVDWINQWFIKYMVSFLLSQLSRFDSFTNIGFLYTTYACDDILVFTISLVSLSITTFSSVIFFIQNFTGTYKYDLLVAGQIDKLYQICNLLEFQAVADILDIISPSNSVVVFGKMFNQRIVNNFIRIIFQDIPFIFIQAIYLIQKQSFNNSMIFSLASSAMMFLVSLNKFLTVTPSRLSQEDFNYLNKIKKDKVLPKYLKKLQQYESQLVLFNQYEMLKCIKSTKYYSQKLKQDQSLSENEIKKKIKMIKQLRQFRPTLDYIEDVFGNQEFCDEQKDFIGFMEQKEQQREQEIKTKLSQGYFQVQGSKHKQHNLKLKKAMVNNIDDNLINLKQKVIYQDPLSKKDQDLENVINDLLLSSSSQQILIQNQRQKNETKDIKTSIYQHSLVQLSNVQKNSSDLAFISKSSENSPQTKNTYFNDGQISEFETDNLLYYSNVLKNSINENHELVNSFNQSQLNKQNEQNK